MTKATSTTSLALVGPRRPPARLLSGLPRGRILRYSLDGYLRARAAPDRVVLWPSGESVADDLSFLHRARERLLWPAPPRDIADAIGGLRESEAPASEPSPQRPSGPLHRALLLEGMVTEDRVRSALSSPPRLWVVESPRVLRLSSATLSRLRLAGVRWAALRPAVVTGVVASAELSRARSRWPAGLPARVPILRSGPPTSRAPSRRPSPR
jgi:hypothetical protein